MSRAGTQERPVSAEGREVTGMLLTLLSVIDAALGEILTTCSKADWIINHGERALRPESRYSTLMLCYKKSQVLYEPLGVVAAIVSWNYRASLNISYW